MKMSTQCLNPMRHLFQPDPIRKSLTLISHSLLQVWPLPTAWGIRSKWFTTVAWFHQDFRLTPLDPRLNSPFLWNCLSNQLIGHIALTFSAKSSWQEWCPPLKVIQERWYRSERKIHLCRLCQTGIISLIVRPSNFYKNNNNQATVCLRGGVQKKCVNKVNQWSQVVPMVEVNGDPRGADFFFVFWTIFMAKNGLKMP